MSHFKKLEKEFDKLLLTEIKDLPSVNQPYYIIRKWNEVIESVRNVQNKQMHLQDAETCAHTTIKKLHKSIKNNHDQILTELQTLLQKGYSGLSMSEIDITQKELTNNETFWTPIWVKFLTSWAGTSKYLPTLKKITEELQDEVVLLHVSVMKPGAKLKPHQGISMSVWRYHYGLDVPEGDVCIKIEDQIYKWQNKKGFIWDDTLVHEVWNNTDKPRFIIFADVLREMPNPFYADMNKYIYHLINRLPHTKEIKEMLEKEGLSLS